MGYTYVSVMCRLCIGYVSVMCRYILGGLGKGDNRKKEGRQHCATARGEQYALPKLQIIRVYYPKLFGTIYNQDLLERRMERMKQMSRRQFVNSGGFVHYQNCSLLEYINQNYLERYIARTYWNGEWSK